MKLSEIQQKTFDEFFITLLTLVKISKQEDDKAWKEAKRRVKFPEYKYTCIGYGADSIDGSGSGAWLNNKILTKCFHANLRESTLLKS